MLKFSANLNFLFTENNTHMLDRFRAAKLAGFRAIETGFSSDISIADAVAVQRETGLEVALLNICLGTFSGGEAGCASFPDREQEFKENLATTIQFAKALNCKKIHLMSGKMAPGQTVTQQHHEMYEKNLRYAAEKLGAEQIVGVIEPISVYGVAGYYLNSYSHAVELVHKINSPFIRIMLDVYHCQHIQGNLTKTITNLMPLLGHVQVAQVPGRNEPNTEGEVNFKHVFKTLEKAGYTSWIGCEYRPVSGSTTDGLQWLTEYGFKL